MRSPDRPAVVVRIEELEKALGAAGSESTGVQADALGVLLQSFEDRGWGGLVALGPGGTGKSLISKVIGASYGLPTYRLDLGALRSRYVGDSEGLIRGAIDTIAAMGDRNVFAVASCNSIIGLPGPLLRRFWGGLWFFDLPSRDGRAAILAIQCRAFGLDPASVPVWVVDRPYSGAELRNLARLVARYGVSWDDAATLITPLYISDAGSIAKLRADARGRYLDAARAGYYAGAADGPGADTVVAQSASAPARAFGGA